MDKNVSWYLNKQIEKVMASLEKNSIKGIFVKESTSCTSFLADFLYIRLYQLQVIF